MIIRTHHDHDGTPYYSAQARCPITNKLLIAEATNRLDAQVYCARMLDASIKRLGKERRINAIKKNHLWVVK